MTQSSGTIRLDVVFKRYHRVAYSTNYTREGINSKIIENIRSRKRSLVQLATITPVRSMPCGLHFDLRYENIFFKLFWLKIHDDVEKNNLSKICAVVSQD